MNVKHKTIMPCVIYLVLIFIFAFFLSSIKNHYYVIGKDYIAAEFISFNDYVKIYMPIFWKEYHKILLLSLFPLMFINYTFVNAIIYMSGKNVFNCIISTVLIACSFEWMSFYVNHGNNFLQISMFAVFMLFIIIMEFIFRLCSRSRLSFIYPFTIGISINMYYGIFILSTSFRLYNFVPLLILVVALYFIRCLLSLLNIDGIKKRILINLMAISIIVLLFVILGFAWYDYSTSDPRHKIWQQLYYVVVYSSFFGIYIMQYLTKILYACNNSAGDVEKKRKLTLRINSVLLTIIPILCVFAVHGIILIISNGIVLLLNFFWVLKKPFDLEKKESNAHLAVAILFTIVTYIYMAVDPIIYLNASEHISMIWPMLVSLAAICSMGLAAFPLLSIIQDKKITKFFPGILNEIKSSFDIKLQILLCIVNFAILVVFTFIYWVKDYANKSRGSLDVGLIDQHLEGFGGLYLLSWCMVPVFFNTLVFLVSVVYSIIKKLLKCQLMDSEKS